MEARTVVIGTTDEALAAVLSDAIRESLPGVDVVAESTAAGLVAVIRAESTACLILDESLPVTELDGLGPDPEAVVANVPVVLLAESTSTELTADGELFDFAEVRTRDEVAENPDFLMPTLRRLITGENRTGVDPVGPELMRLFSEHALPMLLIDPESGSIIAANDAAVVFYRHSREDLTSMAIQDINALDPAEVADRREEAAASSESHFVFPHRLRTGELRTVEVNSTPIVHNGRTVLFSIIQDITGRMEAEERLRVARDRYQRLTEQNIVGIYTVEDERFTYVNPKMAEMFGTTPEAMVGTSIYEYVAEGDRDTVRRHVRERVEGDVETSHYTFAGVHPERDRLVIEVHGSRIEAEDGVAIIGTMLDISDRDAYERKLRRLSKALTAAAPAIYITDVDHVIEYVNPAFTEITGYDESEAIGETPAILSSGRMNDEYYDRLHATLRAGRVWEEAIINRRKGGELYHAYQTIAPYRAEDGTVEGYVAIQSDITDLRIREQVLEVFQRIFRHNLRNQLNIIRGYTDILETEVAGTPLASYTEDIEEAAAALESLSEKAQIVEQTIETNEPGIQTDLVAVIARECETMRAAEPATSIRVDAPVELWVNGDGGIEVAVGEVLQNAIEHCDRRPEIDVRVIEDAAESMGIVEIRDNGPGIDDLELTTLEVGEETPLVHGSGIGLWLVKWAVTSVGGDVVFTENEPRGLTVRLSVPLSHDLE